MCVLTLAVILIANTLAATYIDVRQYRKLSKAKKEDALKVSSDIDWEKTINYNKDKLVFQSVTNFLDTGKDVVILPFLDEWQSLVAKYFKNPAVPLIISYLIFSQILKIPSNAYFAYVLEEKYGFNKTTPLVFLTDILLNLVLTLLIGSSLLYVGFLIISSFSKFELVIGAFFVIVQLVTLWVYPYLIAPLYNKFTPLDDGVLKEKVQALSHKVGFKVGRIDVMDGSKRSGHSNAYFVGLGRIKRIVLYNTILDQLTHEELLAVLGHEFGHWKYNHLPLMLIIGCAEIVAYAFAFRTLISDRSSSTIGVSLLKFMFASSAIALPVTTLSNMIVRVFERQADSFAVSLGYGEELKSALTKLHVENKGTPVVDRMYSTVNFSHPHTLERLQYIEKAMKKEE